MDDPHGRHDLRLCLTCGKPVPTDRDVCPACGAPYSLHATTQPIGTAYSEGFAARRAMADPKKPIVVIGTWMIFGPAFLAMTGMLISGFFASVKDFHNGRLLRSGNWFMDLVLIFAGTAFLGGGSWVSGTILYRTTRNYLRQKAQPEVDDEPDNEDDDSDYGKDESHGESD